MKPTDHFNLFTNNSNGDIFVKPYLKTNPEMGSSSGRWNNPTNNKDSFMSTSPVSSCCQFSSGNGEWSGQGDDITTLVERLEKHKKIFTDYKVQSTVSSPPNFWANKCSQHSTSNQQSLPFNSGYSSQSSRNGTPLLFNGGSSGFSSNNQSTVSSRTSGFQTSSRESFLKPDRFSMNSNYENDRLMQMD